MDSKKSFVKGTIILIIANAISKILGAIFKVPLTFILKEEGMAIYNSAFSIYAFFLSFVISGMPEAISKMVAEEYALKKEQNAKKIVLVSFLILGFLGFFLSLFLWFFADFLSLALKEPKAVYSIKIIAPSVFFVALGAVFKSYYQGKMNMTPTAVSQVIEAIVKLLAGLLFCYYFKNTLPQIKSASAIMGVTIGEIIATFILIVLYFPDHFMMKKKPDKSFKKISQTLIFFALPAILASVFSSFLNIADITLVKKSLEGITFTDTSADLFLRLYSPYTNVFNNLKDTLTLSSDGVRWLWGAYSGYTLTIFHLPLGILGVFGVSALPLISSTLALGKHELATKYVNSLLKIVLIFVVPISFLFMFFSKEILELIFSNSASAPFLTILSPTLIFMSLFSLFTSIQNASGKIISPFIFGIIGGILKIILSIILIRIPVLNMSGAVLGADISYFVVFLLGFFSVKKSFNISFFKLLGKPFLAGLFTSGIMHLIHSPFIHIFKIPSLAFFITLIFGIFFYFLMLFLLNAITKEDFYLLKK